ncbi:MAG: aldehyde ferredoxin oxidoreductase family protein [Desulfitobacteriia bacterium]
MFGYCGWVLEVDLTTKEIKKLPLDTDMARKYIGGAGLGAALYCEAVKGKSISDIDPLSPDNPLIFCTGPLTGSRLPSANRFAVVARSPLTEAWGESNAGGFFAPEIKRAGYDAIVFKGASSEPVILAINDDEVEILPAGNLWGQDSFATNDQLEDRGRVISIGQAGERLSALAAIVVGKHNFFGRMGLGAVMGSKKLKAVVVKGSGKYQPADADKIAEVRKTMIAHQKEHGFLGALSELGSISGVEAGKDAGDLPTKNWQWGKFEGADKIGGVALKENYFKKANTCYACPIACKREVENKEGQYAVESCAGPEYETAAAFGSMCLNDNLASILKSNDLCNRYGIDTISTGAMIAFAIECYEKGYLTKEDTLGLELEWGNPEQIVELVNQIGQVEGFGARLGKGMVQFASELDPKAMDLISSVKGLPAAYHDPRLMWGLGIDFSTNSVGASHVISSGQFAELGMYSMPEVYGRESFIPPSREGKPYFIKRAQDYGASMFGSASYCQFGGVPLKFQDVIDSLNAATGFDYDLEEFMLVGERINNLKRVLSNLWGIRKKDDMLPKRLREGVIGGPNDGVVPPIEEMVEEYYEFRGWDESGFVKQEILDKIDLPAEILESYKKIAG